MKLPKYAWFIILTCSYALLAYETQWNVYVILLLLAISLYIVEVVYEQQYESKKSKENKELQEEIRSTAKDAHLKNKQLLTIVSSIPFPMLLIDQFGNIVMHNNIASLCMSHLEPLTYLDNPFVHGVREFIKDAFILERDMDKIININGVEFQAISIPVLAKSKYSGCLVLFQDISKTLEGEKMQKRFIADASHELKTPISVLKGMVEILNRDDFDDPITEKEFLSQMAKEVQRLDVLVKDLLQLSRLSLSNVILEREKCDVCALFDKACDSLWKNAQKKQLNIQKDYQTLEYAFCDPKRMLQVILNLLSNAIKYSDSGTITLRTRMETTYYILEVEDEGCGIQKKDMEKIFDRFYRVDDARSRQSGGSGLGLPIVRSIIEAHGGNIEVESTYGKGTLFRIKLKN